MALKGVILAGGKGTRLQPLTNVVNKHLLPVGEKPMIYYPIEKLIGAGIQDILIVTGIEHVGTVISQLGSGKEFGCSFTYKVQDEAGGIAQALLLAESFVGSDDCAVILGDNIFQDSISEAAKQFLDSNYEGEIFVKEVEYPQRFGVVNFDNENCATLIEEKPQTPKSNWAVTGVYLYKNSVFEYIRNLKPSQRGELEITDLNNIILSKRKLSVQHLQGWWSDAGTHESIKHATDLVTSSEIYN